jgi:hypothetical protein
MIVGLFLSAMAIYAAQRGEYGICCLALVAMLYACAFVRLPRE